MDKHKQLILANPESVRVRLESNYRIEGDCHIWQGVPDKKGYGYMGVKDAKRGFVTPAAHRVAFLLANGFLPPGEHLHHKCHNPPCINPAHLELKTAKEHGEEHRGSWGRKKQDACNAGHEYVEGSFYLLANGERRCKPCQAETRKRYYERHGDRLRAEGRKEYKAKPLTPEQKARNAARAKAWREANPERYKAAPSRQPEAARRSWATYKERKEQAGQ